MPVHSCEHISIPLLQKPLASIVEPETQAPQNVEYSSKLKSALLIPCSWWLDMGMKEEKIKFCYGGGIEAYALFFFFFYFRAKGFEINFVP